MPLEKLFVHGNVFDADALFARNFNFQTVNQQKRITVRQHLHNFFNMINFSL